MKDTVVWNLRSETSNQKKSSLMVLGAFPLESCIQDSLAGGLSPGLSSVYNGACFQI